MKTTFKRLTSLFVVLAMVVGVMSISAFAADGDDNEDAAESKLEVSADVASKLVPDEDSEESDEQQPEGRFYLELSSNTGAEAGNSDNNPSTGTDTTASFYVDEDYDVEFRVEGSKVLPSDFDMLIAENA